MRFLLGAFLMLNGLAVVYTNEVIRTVDVRLSLSAGPLLISVVSINQQAALILHHHVLNPKLSLLKALIRGNR
jgi:hypothetical protein